MHFQFWWWNSFSHVAAVCSVLKFQLKQSSLASYQTHSHLCSAFRKRRICLPSVSDVRLRSSSIVKDSDKVTESPQGDSPSGYLNISIYNLFQINSHCCKVKLTVNDSISRDFSDLWCVLSSKRIRRNTSFPVNTGTESTGVQSVKDKMKVLPRKP